MKPLKILLLSLLVSLAVSCSEDDAHDHDTDHAEAEGMAIYSHDQIYLKVYEGTFNDMYNTILELEAGSTYEFTVKLLDHDNDEFDAPDEEEYTLGWELSEGTDDIVQMDVSNNDKWTFTFEALKSGSGQVQLQILHAGHADFKTPFININVN